MQFWFFNKSLRNSFPVASNFSVASVQHLKNWEPTLQTFQHGNFQNATPQQTQNSWEQSLNMFCVAKPGQTFQQWHYVIVSKRFWKFRRVVSFLGQHIFFHLAFLMSILWMVARVATHIVFVYKNVSLLGQFCYAHSSGKRKMGQKWKLSNDMFGANARLCDVKLKCSPSLGPNFTTTNWFVCVWFSRTPHRRCFIIKHQSFESYGVFSPTVFSEITQIGFLFDATRCCFCWFFFPFSAWSHWTRFWIAGFVKKSECLKMFKVCSASFSVFVVVIN
jgi:hypothetical protein